jgi:hypothetical protein
MSMVAAVASLSRGRHQRAVPADDAEATETGLEAVRHG